MTKAERVALSVIGVVALLLTLLAHTGCATRVGFIYENKMYDNQAPLGPLAGIDEWMR